MFAKTLFRTLYGPRGKQRRPHHKTQSGGDVNLRHVPFPERNLRPEQAQAEHGGEFSGRVLRNMPVVGGPIENVTGLCRQDHRVLSKSTVILLEIDLKKSSSA